MTAEKHPLEKVRDVLKFYASGTFALVHENRFLEWGESNVEITSTNVIGHRASEALTALTTYMGQPQSCAECERLGRENALLKEAVGPIQGITLGPKLEGLITEQEAVELVNMVINTQLEISAATIAAAGGAE